MNFLVKNGQVPVISAKININADEENKNSCGGQKTIFAVDEATILGTKSSSSNPLADRKKMTTNSIFSILTAGIKDVLIFYRRQQEVRLVRCCLSVCVVLCLGFSSMACNDASVIDLTEYVKKPEPVHPIIGRWKLIEVAQGLPNHYTWEWDSLAIDSLKVVQSSKRILSIVLY